VQTLSNAMDVGNPSNWVRIADMFKADPSSLNHLLTGFSFNDEETKAAINEVFNKDNYIVCPHTAIAWKAAKDWKRQHPEDTSTVVFLSTAHPCKFPEVFSAEIMGKIEIPEQV